MRLVGANQVCDDERTRYGEFLCQQKELAKAIHEYVAAVLPCTLPGVPFLAHGRQPLAALEMDGACCHFDSTEIINVTGI
eukprot:5868298-Prymnesium_polylepis.1